MEKVSVDAIVPEMIAPCGMNCALCSGFLREKRICSGCRSSSSKPAYCASCKIRNCTERGESGEDFCSACPNPCRRLRDLDKRYRTRYRMSMIENLGLIREIGIDAFVLRERKRWECPQCHGVLSVHRVVCASCGWSLNEQ